MSAATVARLLISGAVFPACIVAGIAYMALAISRLVPVEVVECPFTAFR
jgi:hypothetical protein